MYTVLTPDVCYLLEVEWSFLVWQWHMGEIICFQMS
jgi:hypothetical protein